MLPQLLMVVVVVSCAKDEGSPANLSPAHSTVSLKVSETCVPTHRVIVPVLPVGWVDEASGAWVPGPGCSWQWHREHILFLPGRTPPGSSRQSAAACGWGLQIYNIYRHRDENEVMWILIPPKVGACSDSLRTPDFPTVCRMTATNYQTGSQVVAGLTLKRSNIETTFSKKKLCPLWQTNWAIVHQVICRTFCKQTRDFFIAPSSEHKQKLNCNTTSPLFSISTHPHPLHNGLIPPHRPDGCLRLLPSIKRDGLWSPINRRPILGLVIFARAAL